MKKMFMLLAIAMTINFISAQDLALNQNVAFSLKGANINAKSMVNFENPAKVDLFAFFNDNDQNVSVQNKSNDENGTNEMARKRYKGKYFMVGTGYGNSYGGFGVKGQMRFPITKTQGIGVHAGVGFFPYAPVLASAGVKYFPYKDFYINAQFGLYGVEYNLSYISINKKVLYGPAVLVGGDWTWGKKIGFGFNSALGVSYQINATYLPISIAYDMGFIIRF